MKRPMYSLLLLLAADVAGLSHLPAEPVTTPEPTPYRFELQFDDGSWEVCTVHGFQIDFPTSALQVAACYPDEIFKGDFE